MRWEVVRRGRGRGRGRKVGRVGYLFKAAKKGGEVG